MTMPTAGEARRATKKSINERSTNRKPIKKPGTNVSTSSKVKKSSQSKTQNTRIVIKKNGKENIEPKKQGTKAKPAPDFSKLHNKWNTTFQKGKAVAKKPNTKISPFVLTEVQTYTPLSSKSSDSSDKENTEEQEEDDFGFEIDSNALQGILNNTGIQVQQEVHPQTRSTYAGSQKSVPNTISGVSAKRTSIYYTGAKKTTNHQSLKTKGPTSNRPVYGFEARLGKKQVVWADQDDGNDDEISFKPDPSALESILNNKGIAVQQTVGVRHTMASTRSVSFLQNSKRQSFLVSQSSKRTSIYYTGSKSKSVTSEVPRPSLIGRPRTSVLENPTAVPYSQRTAMTPTLAHQYKPGSTVIGKQDEQRVDKGFEMHRFAKPFTASYPETSSQVSKTTDVKPCIINSLMTPCRGKLDARPQAPSTSSKKQVSWADVLTPHRCMDKVKSKEVMLTASRERTDLVDSSPWMKGTSDAIYRPTLEQSPVDDGTVALRLFSDDDTQQETDEKKELELEELERQAIEELKLLEVEEKLSLKESSKGCNNIQTIQLSDISGCEPLTSPQQISNTPRTLTDQWIGATPQNHLRVTIRNKTPIASPLDRPLRTPELLGPRSHTEPMASASPWVNQPSGFQAPNATRFVSQPSQCLIQQQQQQHLPVEGGIEGPTGYAAPKPTPFVSQTGQGLIGRAHPTESVRGEPTPFVNQTSQSLACGILPTNRPEPFTPTQLVAQTPVMNVPLDNGQSFFGLLSSIKKSPFGVGNKRPHSVISNPSFHKSLSWSDTFYASTPAVEALTSAIQEHSTTSNEYHNYPTLPRNSLPTNVSQPFNIPTTSQPSILRDNSSYKPSEFPSSTGALTSGFNDPSGNHPIEQSFARFHASTFEKPAETPWSSLRDNYFSEPAEKPFSSHHGSNYIPAEKPLVNINGSNERSLYGGSNSNGMHLGVSGNDNVHSNRVGGQTYRACTSVAPLFAMTNLVQSNSQTATSCTYTNSSSLGKETVVSIHSPAFIHQQHDTNLSTNSDHLCKRPGISNVAYVNRSTKLDTGSAPRTSRFHSDNSDSLSLRSAVESLGFKRREPVVDKRAVTTTNRKTGQTCALSQNKSLDVQLPKSLETRTSLVEEALLDTEVALYTTLGVRIRKRCTRDLSNPLAKTFEVGDSQHIVPICVCNDKIYCSVHPVFQSPLLVRRENVK